LKFVCFAEKRNISIMDDWIGTIVAQLVVMYARIVNHYE